MAYRLKTSGIAANCTMCIAVDPDTSTIKDFASSAVTADMTIGANVTTGSQAWNGSTRHYWRLGSGTAAADFIAFGTNKPSWTNNTAGMQRTVVFIGEAAGSAARLFGKDSSNYVSSQNGASGGATFPTVAGLGWASPATAGAAAIASGNKRIFGFSSVHGTSATAYYAADTDTSVTGVSVAAPSSTSTANNMTLDYVGRRNDSTTHQQDKVHAILIFDASLTQTQMDSLRSDWFGTLLEVDPGSGNSASPGVATLLLSGYAPTVEQFTPYNGVPGPGTLSLTGFAPSVVQAGPNSYSPGVGSLTLTGFAPSVVQAAAWGTVTTDELRIGTTRALLANVSGWTLVVKNASTDAVVLTLTGLTTSSAGKLTTGANALLTIGATYAYEARHATYGRVLPTALAT